MHSWSANYKFPCSSFVRGSLVQLCFLFVFLRIISLRVKFYVSVLFQHFPCFTLFPPILMISGENSDVLILLPLWEAGHLIWFFCLPSRFSFIFDILWFECNILEMWVLLLVLFIYHRCFFVPDVFWTSWICVLLSVTTCKESLVIITSETKCKSNT